MLTQRQRDMLSDPWPYIADAWETESKEFAEACKAAAAYIAEIERKIQR